MASSYPQIEDISDKNCERSCNLEYGISENFNQNVIQQQYIKASKAHIQPKLFDDPKEQANHTHMMDDVMLKIFDDLSEKKIFQKALEGMASNYPKILQGTEKNMFYCPTVFNFDSRIGTIETSVPDLLDEMKAPLEARQISSLRQTESQGRSVNRITKAISWIKNKIGISRQNCFPLTQQELLNLRAIQNHLRRLRPQLAEQEFVDGLASFFYQHRGIFIHSLKLDEHLKVLTDKAKLYRRQNKSSGFELTDLEKKLAEQFNISAQSLNGFADGIVKHIVAHFNVTGNQPVNGRIVRQAIDDQLTGSEQMYVKKLFKLRQDYSIDEITKGCKLGKFESEIHFAGETDLLIMLPDSKLILSIEIKRHMKCKDPNSETKQTSRIDRNMKSASSQLNKNGGFISSRHGAILSPGWKFVKICAISPSFNSSEKICKNCHRFILTSAILRTPGGLEKWWEETGLAERTKKYDQKTKDEAYTEFQLFFNRLVCLSSVRVVPDPLHTWNQIQGDNPHHMSAGHTRAAQGAPNQDLGRDVDVGDILNRSHDAYKVLFFNKEQMALLTADNLFHALFMCDFGAGN